MKIAVTGGTGFVGTHLLKKLSEENLVIIGRRSVAIPGATFHKCTIGNKTDFGSVLDSVSVVVHCAARAHIMNDDAQEPLTEFREVNTHGTVNLAKQAASAGVRRFIYISSIKVNGESTEASNPFQYNDNHNPLDPYGLSKSEAETALFELGKKTGMEIVVIRPPLVYGKGVKANFASLMNLVAKGLPLPFRSIKNNKRSMVSVYNLVDLIVTCIKHPKAANQVFLASDDNDLSTAQMVALMAKVQGKRNFALPVPVWLFNVAAKLLNKQAVVNRLTGSLQLNIEHTKHTLNWKAPYSVEHGFKLSVKNK
ncbi:UDP-glucose 4-epimerase family protein [Colwellia sp. TT2012]|uniref:UDP-glucose 4-epimerase family protein n=1 Tax=Colwellia sp. TT2012 TaxID=1720342 RepID=UPI00070B8AF0|nr:SDR family oxidoreductase [Colwellia sp. TT2012]